MIKKLLKRLIRGYQKGISPALPPSCIYEPTCSNYALQAIEKHGALKGSLMAGARILRCHPFAEGGLDEVPDYFTLRRNPSRSHEAEYYFRHLPQLVALSELERKQLDEWLEEYGPELKVRDHLPRAEEVLGELAEVEEWSVDQMKDYLSQHESDLELNGEEWRYFYLPATPQSQPYQPVDLPLAGEEILPDIFIFVDRELGFLEAVNSSRLGYDYLKYYGATAADLAEPSVYLYRVFAQMDALKNGAE